MKQIKVICEKCNGVVETSEDLVTATQFFPVVAYHSSCYIDDVKSSKGLMLSATPLNGVGYTLIAITVALIGVIGMIGTLYLGKINLFFLLVLIPLVYRLYSYFIYERPLKRLVNNE